MILHDGKKTGEVQFVCVFQLCFPGAGHQTTKLDIDSTLLKVLTDHAIMMNFRMFKACSRIEQEYLILELRSVWDRCWSSSRNMTGTSFLNFSMSIRVLMIIPCSGAKELPLSSFLLSFSWSPRFKTNGQASRSLYHLVQVRDGTIIRMYCSVATSSLTLPEPLNANFCQISQVHHSQCVQIRCTQNHSNRSIDIISRDNVLCLWSTKPSQIIARKQDLQASISIHPLSCSGSLAFFVDDISQPQMRSPIQVIHKAKDCDVSCYIPISRIAFYIGLLCENLIYHGQLGCSSFANFHWELQLILDKPSSSCLTLDW